jgi:hypothetical protein
MVEARKIAYRQLLYLALNDIRQIRNVGEPPDWTWNPKMPRDDVGWIVRAGDIANWLENLAGFSSAEFEGFDEGRFWGEHAKVCERFPDVAGYRAFFETTLREFGGSVGQ